MDETKELALLAKFDELAGEMGSANKAAQRIGIPASTISMLKKGAYSGNKDAQFAKLAAYFDTKTEGAESYSEVDYAPTSISEKIYQTTLVSTNISIKTVVQPAKTSFARSSGSSATNEKSIKIREYKLPALMQLLNGNGHKPV